MLRGNHARSIDPLLRREDVIPVLTGLTEVRVCTAEDDSRWRLMRVDEKGEGGLVDVEVAGHERMRSIVSTERKTRDCCCQVAHGRRSPEGGRGRIKSRSHQTVSDAVLGSGVMTSRAFVDSQSGKYTSSAQDLERCLLFRGGRTFGHDQALPYQPKRRQNVSEEAKRLSFR